MPKEMGFSLSVWDRLMAASESPDPARAMQAMTMEQLKAAVARDLEGLLNTRLAIPEGWLDRYPACRTSVLNYGLRDFAGMCLTSSDDRKVICQYLKAAIECFEPRLCNVRAEVFTGPSSTNRLDFVISATLRAQGAKGHIEFNAMLQPSTLHYSISPTARRANSMKAAL